MDFFSFFWGGGRFLPAPVRPPRYSTPPLSRSAPTACNHLWQVWWEWEQVCVCPDEEADSIPQWETNSAFVSGGCLELNRHSLMEGRGAHAGRLLHLGIFSLGLDKIRYAGGAGGRRRFPLVSRSYTRDIQEGLFVVQSLNIFFAK